MPEESAIRAALPDFTGDLLQVPPMASALKLEGLRLYDLHRRGVSVEREPRPVRVHSLTLTAIDPQTETVGFEISCSSGTYVRTLIADLAEHLETGAYLTSLRRTRVGHLRVEQAANPEELTPSTIRNRIIQANVVVSHLPAVEVDEADERAVRSGRVLRFAGMAGSFRVERGGILLAVYRDDGEVSRAEVVLCGG
jgi:tRNA pseudouridine55 synthase